QNWNEQLLDNLITDLGDASSASFLAAFQKIFERKEIEYLNIAKWHQFLTVFHPRDEWGLNRYQYQKIMDILDQAKNYLLEMEAKIESKRRHKMEVFTERLIEIGHSLTAISSFNELTDVLAQEIPKLGIPSYYLSLYDQRENSYEWSRLILACNLNERIPIDLKNGGVKFRSRELIPEGYFTDQQVWNQIVEPIFFREHQLGFAIFETGPKEAVVYAMLRTQLSSALWGVIFFEKQKKTEAALAWKAQELARSNSELERFAYVASHDLQEPLRKITLFGESLAKTAKAKLNEKERDYLERMINAAGRMQRLIIDLLTFSRVTTKARPFTMVDLNEVGKEVVSDLEVKIRNTNADIEIGELPSIEAEPVQMRQLFQNLIGNSLKFHRPNIPPRIRVYGRITPEQQCELTFEDNGIGIDPSNYQKIFGLFERLHGMGEYEGSGVGLAICHKIVERHRGEIKIDSQVGVGTKFIICLPVHQTDLSA
ncbi:MAG: hypothetical protein GX075_12400, partial [Firmicutes bacterium]|nr:hypothetical protein [Bacillota bacterium]